MSNGSLSDLITHLRSIISNEELENIKGLAKVVKGCKDTLGRLIGAELTGSGGNLFYQIEAYLHSYTGFPNLDSSQRERVFAQLGHYLKTAEETILDAQKHNNILAQEISKLRVDDEHEQTIQDLVKLQCNESTNLNRRLNNFLEKVGQFTAQAGISLGDIMNSRSNVQSESSSAQRSAQLVSAPKHGKINVSIPGCPDKLAYNLTPSALTLWFTRWGYWWNLAYEGSPNSNKLCNFIRTKLDDAWLRSLDNIDWNNIETPELLTIMDKRLETAFLPPSCAQQIS